LLTAAERSLFGVLHEAFGAKYFIFAKVRLADLVWLPKGTESRQSHQNRVQSKHLDFVICDRATVRPLVAIELDDSSHSRADRVERDVFLNEVLAAAGLPFVRIRAAASYNVRELAQQVQAAVQAGGK
jgi:very-short-patch-repair endonuclease